MKELYNSNANFKTYVDRYCSTCSSTVDQALEHALVKAVADQYTHPDDTYSFGNVEPMMPLTHSERIRIMSDEELAEDRVECMNRYRSPYKGYVGDFDGVRDSRDQAVVAELEWMKQEV